MNKQNTKRNLQKIIILILIILLVPTINALTIQTPELISSFNQEEIKFDIKTKNNESNITITTNPEMGEIINNEKFKWITDFGDEIYQEIEFKAKDNKANATSKTIIAKKTTITGLVNDTITKNTYAFSLTTNIAATCKYSLTEKDYENMEYTMKTMNEIEHEATTPKLKQDNYEIQVICKTEKNAETKKTFNLDVNLPPTAEIRLTPPSPLKAGIIEVEVIASEDLIKAPELRYFFDDDTSTRSVTLTGSKNRWRGHIVIQEIDKRRIGTFTFKGIDTTNQEGTRITSGKTFIVDNYEPTTISSFQGTIKQDRINLEWRYLNDDTDDIKEYRIYRRVGSGGTDYVDYYKTTSNNYYQDRDVEYGEAYYYKITAVNKAGKEGTLSKEVALTFIPEKEEEQEEQEELSPILRTQLNTVMNEVDKKIMDVELIENKLQEKANQEPILLQDLNILSKIVPAKNKLQNIKQELKDLEIKDLSESEFDVATNNFLNEARQTTSNLPQDIKIKDTITYIEPKNQELINTAIQSYLESKNIDIQTREARRLIQNTINEQNNFEVEVIITKAKIIYLDSEAEITHITKKITTNKDAQEVIILDKLTQEQIQNIQFMERPQTLRNQVLMWEITNIKNKEIRYYSQKNIETDIIRNTQLTILNDREIKETQNLITGLATEKTPGANTSLIVPLIIGILSILILSVYYFKDEDLNILELFSIRNILLRKTKKQNQEHKKLDLDTPPKQEELKDIELNKEETNTLVEYMNAHQTNNEIDDAPTPKQEITKIETETETETNQEDVYDVLKDLKNMMEDIYFEDDFENLELLTKLKQIKKKYNKETPRGKEFILNTGDSIKTINELRKKLKTMTKETFHYHVNEEKNDFYNWIKDVFKYKGLAYKIKRVKTKKELLAKLKP